GRLNGEAGGAVERDRSCADAVREVREGDSGAAPEVGPGDVGAGSTGRGAGRHAQARDRRSGVADREDASAGTADVAVEVFGEAPEVKDELGLGARLAAAEQLAVAHQRPGDARDDRGRRRRDAVRGRAALGAGPAPALRVVTEARRRAVAMRVRGAEVVPHLVGDDQGVAGKIAHLEDLAEAVAGSGAAEPAEPGDPGGGATARLLAGEDGGNGAPDVPVVQTPVAPELVEFVAVGVSAGVLRVGVGRG